MDMECKWHVSHPDLFTAIKNPLPLLVAIQVSERLKLIRKAS